VESIYEVPLVYHEQGLDDYIVEFLGLDAPQPDLSEWQNIVQRIKKPEKHVRIGICGKYVNLKDAYKSIIESFVHAGVANDVHVNLTWVDTEQISRYNAKRKLSRFAGILVPGGFGSRGIEGKLETVRYARLNKVPMFGICLGMQCAIVEFARNVCGLPETTSCEFDPESAHQVISLMPDQAEVTEKGGTMRLGAYPCELKEGSRVREIYGDNPISERHRHRYEVNNKYRDALSSKGMVFSGLSPNGQLVEIIELKRHPWFIGCQFHPELKSRPMRPHPLFRDFVRAARDYDSERKGKQTG
jgi:CTP synthase